MTDQDADLTIPEACSVLNPPISERQLAAIIRALGVQPLGTRRTRHPGRRQRTYPACDIMQLHAALAPWLGNSVH